MVAHGEKSAFRTSFPRPVDLWGVPNSIHESEPVFPSPTLF